VSIGEYTDEHGIHQCSIALIADNNFSHLQAELPGNILFHLSGKRDTSLLSIGSGQLGDFLLTPYNIDLPEAYAPQVKPTLDLLLLPEQEQWKCAVVLQVT
jgi:hypothetical protein